MVDHDSNFPSSSSKTHTTLRDAPDDPRSRRSDSPNSPSSSSASWLDDLQQGDNDETSIYTYTSTWSTNYTMSNLAGPGRLLGKLYSRAGSSLERQLGKLAHRAGLGGHAKAEDLLQGTGEISRLMMSDNSKDWEKACGILVRYASSNDPKVQVMAFDDITEHFARYPSRFRSSFESFFRKRNENADVVTFSWKRPGTEYSAVWLHHYKLVSRCLSMPSGPFMLTTTQFDLDKEMSFYFEDFEEMLFNCTDVPDKLLAVSITETYWNTQGIKRRVKEKGFKDPTLLKFATALVLRCEVGYSLLAKPTADEDLQPPPWPVLVFVEAIWKSLRHVQPEQFSEDDFQSSLWVELFKLHFVARTTFFVTDDNAKTLLFRLIPKTWSELCEELVPGSECAKVRVKLLAIERRYEQATRKRFPALARPHEVT